MEGQNVGGCGGYITVNQEDLVLLLLGCLMILKLEALELEESRLGFLVLVLGLRA